MGRASEYGARRNPCDTDAVADALYDRRSDKTMSNTEPGRHTYANAEPDNGAVI